MVLILLLFLGRVFCVMLVKFVSFNIFSSTTPVQALGFSGATSYHNIQAIRNLENGTNQSSYDEAKSSLGSTTTAPTAFVLASVTVPKLSTTAGAIAGGFLLCGLAKNKQKKKN